MTGTSALVRGHTLRSEGKPHKVLVTTESGTKIAQRIYDSKAGRGLCSCQALSDLLPSDGRRKQWHREHKAQVLAAATDTPPPAVAGLSQM